MASKLKLKADPTFKSKVKIPVAGSRPVDVEFTFKHRTRDETLRFIEESATREDVVTIMECVVAWEFADAFTAENVSLLLQNYQGSARAISTRYFAELSGAVAGN